MIKAYYLVLSYKHTIQDNTKKTGPMLSSNYRDIITTAKFKNGFHNLRNDTIEISSNIGQVQLNKEKGVCLYTCLKTGCSTSRPNFGRGGMVGDYFIDVSERSCRWLKQLEYDEIVNDVLSLKIHICNSFVNTDEILFVFIPVLTSTGGTEYNSYITCKLIMVNNEYIYTTSQCCFMDSVVDCLAIVDPSKHDIAHAKNISVPEEFENLSFNHTTNFIDYLSYDRCVKFRDGIVNKTLVSCTSKNSDLASLSLSSKSGDIDFLYGLIITHAKSLSILFINNNDFKMDLPIITHVNKKDSNVIIQFRPPKMLRTNCVFSLFVMINEQLLDGFATYRYKNTNDMSYNIHLLSVCNISQLFKFLFETSTTEHDLKKSVMYFELKYGWFMDVMGYNIGGRLREIGCSSDDFEYEDSMPERSNRMMAFYPPKKNPTMH